MSLYIFGARIGGRPLPIFVQGVAESMHPHQRTRLLGWGAMAACLSSLLLLFLAAPGTPWAGAPLPLGECGALSTWLGRWMTPGAYSNTTLPLPEAGTGDLAVQQLELVTHDTLRRVGWRSGVRFAELSELGGGLEGVLATPYNAARAFLVIVPAGELPPRWEVVASCYDLLLPANDFLQVGGADTNKGCH